MPNPLTPAIQTDSVIVYLGDTVTVLPMLEPESVDSIITDPPDGRSAAPKPGTELPVPLATDGVTSGYQQALGDDSGAQISGLECWAA